MINNLIAYAHFIGSSIIATYFIWRRPEFDAYYLLYFILLNLSWVIFYNECLISYMFKKNNDPDYKMGDSNKVEDYDIVLGKPGAELFLNYVVPTLYSLNLIVIAFFSKMGKNINTKSYLVLAIFAYVIYMSSLRLPLNESERGKIKTLNGIFYGTLLCLTLYNMFIK